MALPIPASDYLKRADLRTAQQLCSDTNDEIAESALATNANFLEALSGGSGDFVAVVTAMGRYTSTTLGALTGSAESMMYDVIAPLVTKRLYQRRPDRAPVGQPPGYVEALWRSERLKLGDEVLA